MARPLLALGSSLLAATLSTGVQTAETSATTLARFDRTAPSAAITRALPQAAAVLPPSPSEGPSARHAPPLRIPLANSLLIAPHGCAALGRSFDVLLHFHGAYTTTEPQLMNSGLDAVYLVKNLGNGSGPYETAFSTKGSLQAELAGIRARINKSCGGPERAVGRVALSGWSAGYGAIYRILARPEEAARVDAILLADGMHVGFEPASRRVRGAAMAPFIDFANAATRGEKLMAVTHSAIVPPSYASTSATANYIVNQLNLAPAAERAPEPRAGMHATSNDERGDLHVTGYAGDDAHAHCDHLYAISSTLWSRLRQRWARPASDAR